MSKRKQGTAKFFKTVSFVIIVMLLVGMCGFFAYFTNGLTTNFKSFYVVVNGDSVLSSASGYKLTANDLLEVDVKYTFSFISKEISGYTVKVVPKTDEVDFVVNVDNTSYKFSEMNDCTAGFNIELKENSFTLVPKGSLIDILSSLYVDKNVIVDENSVDFSKDLFTVVITSYNNEATVLLNVSVTGTSVSGIVIDITEGVF